MGHVNAGAVAQCRGVRVFTRSYCFLSADWQYVLQTHLAPDKYMGMELDFLYQTREAVSRFFLTDASEVKLTYI